MAQKASGIDASVEILATISSCPATDAQHFTKEMIT